MIDSVRCHRLKMECRPAVRDRRPLSQRARLEERLDGLESLLKAGSPSTSKSARLQERLDGLESLLKTGAPSDAIAAIHNPTHHSNIETNDETALTPGTTDTEGTSSNSTESVPHNTVEPSPVEAEAEIYLTAFRCHKSNFFPFVYVPSIITAQQLRQERPFLWLRIMTIASKSTSQQQVLGSKIRETLAQEMLLKSGQSIGLLAYIGWYGFPRPQDWTVRY